MVDIECTYTRAHAQNGNRHFCHFFKLSPEVRPCRSRCWRPRSRWCWPPRPPRAAGPRASRPRPGPLGRARSCRVSWGRGAVTASESIAFGLVSPPGVGPDSTYPCCRCVREPCQTSRGSTDIVQVPSNMASPGLPALARCAWNCFVVVLDIATPFLPAVWAVFPARTPPLPPLSSRCC